ncbi:MAG TPA: type II toxin-antitoxin system prevent-host-death family antitoxin [Vicinamibacterales bacterium]
MRIAAAQSKAKWLALLDEVRDRGEPITITKRGRVVARLVPANDEDDRPWRRLLGTARWNRDPFAPATVTPVRSGASSPTFARPKSRIVTTPEGVILMFAGSSHDGRSRARARRRDRRQSAAMSAAAAGDTPPWSDALRARYSASVSASTSSSTSARTVPPSAPTAFSTP